MADYSTIKGFTIQSLATDPYATAALSGTWASGGTMAIAGANRFGFGTQSAAGMAAGNPSPGGATEEYDGTSWTTGNNVQDPRGNGASCGTQTAAIISGGESPAETGNTETYDGTSWTEVNNLTTARAKNRGCGTSTAALSAGGYTPLTAKVEEWDGTSWTEGNDLATATGAGAAVGIVTAALYYGGEVPGYTAQTETYNGTSWTEVSDMNSGRGSLGGFGTSNTNAIAASGTPNTVNCEAWNGTSWTEVGNLATGREGLCNNSAGNSTAGLIAGGDTPGAGNTDASEEWSTASPLSVAQEGQVWYNTTSTVLKGFGLTLGSGAWASGTVVNTGRLNASAAGASQDSAVFMGGAPVGGTAVAITEQYDGTTWTEVGDLNIPRKLFVGIGTQTAAIAAGGVAPTPTPVGPNLQECEQWNGTSWTEIADLGRSDTPPVSTSYAMGFGTTTSAIFAGGAEGDPGQLSLSEQWNGTSWSEGNDLTHSMGYGAMAGASGDSGLITGGGTFVPAWDAYDGNQVWNGTSWSEENNLNQKRYGCIGSCQGTVSDSVVFGGNTNAPAASADTEHWNGTCWTELANLATGRWYLGGAGVGRNALAISGNAPPTTAVVEEWTIPSSYTTKTFTAS